MRPPLARAPEAISEPSRLRRLNRLRDEGELRAMALLRVGIVLGGVLTAGIVGLGLGSLIVEFTGGG